MKPDSRIRVMEIIARMNVGGPATQVLGLREGLNPEEFDHRLYTGYVDDGEGDHLRLHEAETRVHRVPGLGRSIRLGDDYHALFWLIRAMRAFRPHIVHTRTAKAGALGRVAARLSGVGAARVHVFHGHLLHGYFSPAKRGLYVRSERLLASMSDRLVTVGSQVRDELLQAGIGRPPQYVVIPPGVRLGPIPTRQEARATLGLPQDAPVVAYVGRLTRVKRPDRFLTVAGSVIRQVPGCRFVVCGRGELEQQVQRDIEGARDSFHLVGWRKDVETVYAAADMVLLTSDNEGTPLTLIEAGMAGTPVVATRVGSVAEVVRDGQTGLLAAPDPGELAMHVIRMLSEPDLARRMGTLARDWTTHAFGVERLVSDTEHLYRSLRGTPGRHPVTKENPR
ncbi:glycosyltransferase involved in cell wall biosynthesis [Streptosporangium becharense]|uniref:Glycosyltransferase involved in cell wall biosynthesis n=1 Tax=Streptosporangium becharense TaxID=1816182 RepID=A0A7W9ILJ4_9ACTN|nr:glycosyltransferase [Streptosporangium becharense]MBB2911636.1 glycosyltransferase involved in cell wall biosynthesis [Streptosporangium becharense]MBB5822546.1 glycosyltransferase involved in cell wall biosynthesis [Streptosporangium becharense]